MFGMISKCYSTLRGHALSSYSTQSCQRSGGGHEARSRTVIGSPPGAICCRKGISVIELLQALTSTKRYNLSGDYKTMLVGAKAHQGNNSCQSEEDWLGKRAQQRNAK